MSEIAYTALSERLGALPGLEQKRMFGGVCFLLSGNMICGAMKTGAILRPGADQHEAALARPGAEPAIMGGRRMGGFVRMGEAAIIENEETLDELLALSLSFVRSLPPK